MQLGVDICGRGYSQIDRIGADDPQLVRQLDVGGVGDGDLETALLDPVRKRADPRQDVQRDRIGGIRVDLLGAEVDQRQAVELR
jgi:hypothetical protein